MARVPHSAGPLFAGCLRSLEMTRLAERTPPSRGTEDSSGADDRPPMEPLTAAEKEAFLARARAEGRLLTSAEQYALFGPPPAPAAPAPPPIEVAEMEAAWLDDAQIRQLQQHFFPELGEPAQLPDFSLVRGVILDLDYTLAELSRDPATLWEEGARAAADYMRGTGMDLPDDFWQNIIEARRFAEEKSEEEQEEHIADDAMSFLLQFFGYPASRMDPDILRRAVDIFYAPEMTAWRLRPGAQAMLAALRSAGYKLALMTHHNCERVFQRTVDFLGIRPYFDLVVCSGGVEFRKPDVKFLEIALTRWDALPYEVVVVGDSLRHDIAGGIELGALTVLLDVLLEGGEGRGPAQVQFDNQQLAGQVTPDARIADLGALPDLIQQWATP